MSEEGGFQTRPYNPNYIFAFPSTKLLRTISNSVTPVFPFENTGRSDLGQFKQNPLITSLQHGVLESRSTWMFPEVFLRTYGFLYSLSKNDSRANLSTIELS